MTKETQPTNQGNQNFIQRRLVVSIGGCFLIVACCVLVSLIYFGNTAIKSLQPPEGVNITSHIPPEVHKGDEFEILIEIENTQLEAQNLIAIGFMHDYLTGIQIVDSTPTFIYNESMTVLEMPIQLLTFQEMILQGELLTIRFQAEAIEVGDFGGEIQVCLNRATNCERIPTRTIVVP